MSRRLVTVGVCALALTLSGAAAAHADSHVLVDGTGDVWQLSDSDTGPHTRVPDRRQGDIVRVAFAHRRHRVVVRARFAQLNRRAGRYGVVTRLRTDTGSVRWIRVHVGPGRSTWRGEARVFRRDNFTRVACAVAHRIDYRRDLAVVAVPRSCLGKPRSVQGAFGVVTFVGADVFADNPFDDGPTVNLPDHTPRIRRALTDQGA
jgi:hypothetical protein